MSSVQVYEICKACNKPSKARVEFLEKVKIVDLVCDCDKKKREQDEKKRCKARKYYGES